MSNPTTPFSWQMPTATDLVTDLPADFEVFGQAVATSMADLLGGTSGQILAKNSNTDMDFVWIANDQGDITGITATSPLTGGGTSGAVTLGILSGTTSNLGAVQLSDSTSSTSTTLAATANAVKTTYDLANAAIPKSLIDAAGDLIVGTAADTAGRLGIGTAGQVLKVNSGATALEWGSASSSATSYTLINTGGTSLTGSSVTISSLGGYNKLFVIIDNFSCANPTDIFVRINADSGSNYRAAGFGYNGTESTVTAAFGAGYNGNTADKLSLGTFYGTSQAGGATIMIDGANGSGLKTYQVSVGGSSTAYIYPVMQGVYSGSAITSLVFHSLTQNWDAGTVRIYGA